MNWIEELVLKRNAQRSNCYIIETFDPRRIEQFRDLLESGKFDELVRTKYVRLLEYDLQRGRILDLKDKAPLRTSPMGSPIDNIREQLADVSTVLTIKYVFNESHANMISEMLVAWAHDEDLYTHKSTVVVFTSSASLFSESVRRFVHTITINPSTPEERREVLKRLVKELSAAFEQKYGKKLRLKVNEDLIQATSGLTLHDVETAALESFYTTRKFDVKTFTNYKTQLLKNYGIEYITPKRGFESVGGYRLLKSYVRKRIIALLRHPEKAKYYGLTAPRGILLYGYTGTGKTWFAKAMAKEIGLPMLKISPADFLRGIVGETEARIRQLTQLMESLAPIVIFLDEYDQLAMSRAGQFIGDSGVSRRMQNMLLDWLGDENRKSFIIGATNFVEQCDQAFLRTGRIDKIVLVLPPDFEARKEILKVHVDVVRKVPVDINLTRIAERTFMWTGAEIERLVLDASALAMDEDSKYVTQEHFEEALSLIDVNVRERETRINEMISTAKKLENVDTAFLKEAVKEFVAGEKDKSRIKKFMEAI